MVTARDDAGALFVGAQNLVAGMGGIAVAARLSARVLVGLSKDIRLVSLLDEHDGVVADRRWRSAKGNRLSFVAQCHLAALHCNHFVYDSVSTARAHPRLPGLRRPYAVWMHGIEVWYSLHKDRARALRAADIVLVNSQTTLQRFQELHGPLETAVVCPLGTEADEAPPPAPRTGGRPTVLILGTINLSAFYKGHKELIECWPDVVAQVPDARLVIAGGGTGLDHVRGLVAASPAAASIEVKGFVPEDAVADLWRSADVFAMPSRKEGFGLVYVEAMRHRLPVIASVHDAGREVNVDGQTGYNVDLDRPGELADRLVALLGSPEGALRMGQRGHGRWRELYRFSVFKERLERLLGPFLAGRTA